MKVEITELGYVCIPTVILVLGWRPRLLLSLTTFLSFFQAASVVNVSSGDYSFGLQPGYFSAIALLAYLVWRAIPRRWGGEIAITSITHTCAPLLIFALLGAFSSFTFPVLFRHQVRVFPPREGVLIASESLLELGPTNFSQTIYLLFLVILTLAVATHIAENPRRVRQVSMAMLLGGSVAALVGLYQVAGFYWGLPYPHSVLNSNPGYTQWYSQVIEGHTPRLSGTFTEPSIAALHFVGVLSLALWLAGSRRNKISRFMVILISGGALLLTTSTTGYVALPLVLGATFVARAISNIPRERRAVAVAVSLWIALLASVLLVTNLTAQGLQAENVRDVLRSEVLEKQRSLSFQNRTAVDLSNIRLVGQTYGLGVGWGSTRSSGLLPHLLANGGVWGLGLVLVFARHIRIRSRQVWNAGNLNLISTGRALSAALLAMLLSGLIAVPDTTYLTFWLALAALVGVVNSQASAKLLHGPLSHLTSSADQPSESRSALRSRDSLRYLPLGTSRK